MATDSPAYDEVFSRQLLLPEIGPDGQAALLRAHVTVVGVGAVGSRIAELLCRAGVGRLTLIDRDFVDFSNIPRQTLFTWHDAEEEIPKAEAARRRLNEIMPTCQVFPRVADLTPDAAHFLLHGADVVADGTDNVETRYLVNDWCVSQGVPWVYAGALGTKASVFPVLGRDRCLRCAFPEKPPPGTLATCDTLGVLNAATAVAAAHAATFIVRIVLGDAPDSAWHTWDVWSGERSSLSLDKLRAAHGNTPCPLCKQGKTEFLDAEVTASTVTLCGRDTVQVTLGELVDLGALEKRLPAELNAWNNGDLLRFKAEGHTIRVFTDGRVMVQGTGELSVARSLIDKWLGT